MPKLNLERLKRDLRAALTGEIIVRHYLPNEDLASAKAGDEYKVKCCLPGHVDDTPSLFISESKFVYHCKGQCGGDVSKGDFIKFIQVMDGLGFMDAVKKACDLCGLSISAYEEGGDGGVEPKASPKPEAKKTRKKKQRPPIDAEVVEGMHKALLANKESLDKFCKRRNLSVDDIREYKIGIKFGNYTLPIYDKDGAIATIKYRHRIEKPDGFPKYWSHKAARVDDPDKKNKKHWWMYGETKLFGVQNLLAADDGCIVIVTAGEYDAIQINRLKRKDIIAVSSTSGEGTWDPDWNYMLDGHSVYVCFDNDPTGAVKSKEISKLLPNLKIMSLEGHVGEKGDITDFFSAGHTIDELLLLASKAETKAKTATNQSSGTLSLLSLIREKQTREMNPTFFVDHNGEVYITVQCDLNVAEDLDQDPKYATEIVNDVPLIVCSDKNLYEIPRVDPQRLRDDSTLRAIFNGKWKVKSTPDYATRNWPSEKMVGWLNGDRELFSDPVKAFEDIYFTIKKYSKFPRKRYRGLAALYIMGSYFYEAFDSYPYMFINGEKGSGKSTLGKVISILGFNGDFVTSPSYAVMARLIDQTKGLIVIDEIEQQTQRVQGRTEMGQILNSGYQRGAKRVICDVDNKNKPREYDIYCPKVLANIFGLNDTLQSRCITVKMQKIKASGFSIGNPSADYSLKAIAINMYEVMMSKTPVVISCYKRVKAMNRFEVIETQDLPSDAPKTLSVTGRERELYNPLLAMALFLYEESGKKKKWARPWNDLLLELMDISSERAVDEEDEPEYVLRSSIMNILEEAKVDSKEMSMYDIVMAYRGFYIESPGNRIEKWITRQLKKFEWCEPYTKLKRKRVYVHITAKDGTLVKEKKFLSVFTITRQRLGMVSCTEEDELTIPF